MTVAQLHSFLSALIASNQGNSTVTAKCLVKRTLVVGNVTNLDQQVAGILNSAGEPEMKSTIVLTVEHVPGPVKTRKPRTPKTAPVAGATTVPTVKGKKGEAVTAAA